MTLSITVEQNPTISTGKKKRAVDDLAAYVPGELDGTGREMVQKAVSIQSLS